jgi:hypothetical protein
LFKPVKLAEIISVGIVGEILRETVTWKENLARSLAETILELVSDRSEAIQMIRTEVATLSENAMEHADLRSREIGRVIHEVLEESWRRSTPQEGKN